jgi:hypothetical protein
MPAIKIMKEEIFTRRSRMLLKFLSAPFILKLYCLFATFVTIFVLAIAVAGKSSSAIIGPLLPLSYMFGLYFIYAIIFSSDKSINKKRLRLGLIAQLAFYCLLSFYMLFIDHYRLVIVNDWLIFWMIILPMVWIILLMTKQVTTFLIGIRLSN